MYIKGIFLLLIVVSSSCKISYSQVLEREEVDSTEVTPQVLQSYKVELGDIEDIEWYKVGGLSYEAHFVKNGKKFIALFYADGRMRDIKHEVEMEEVDKALIATIEEKNPGFQITHVYVEELSKDSIKYIFYLYNGKERRVSEIKW